MPTVSGIGTSGTSLFQYLQQIKNGNKSSTSAQMASTAESTSAVRTKPAGPPRGDFDQKLTQELESQGFTGTKLSDLKTKIQDAVSTAMQSMDSTTDRGQSVRTAVEKVLKDAGVDVDKLNQDMGIGKDGPPEASQATDGSTEASQALDAFMKMLDQQGIDPKQFLDRLQSMAQNSNGQTMDISQLFSGVAVGSEIDVKA